MKLLVVLGHPDPKSFCAAIAKRCVETLENNGHQVIFHDLQSENFNPLVTTEEIKKKKLPPDIEKHCKELSTCEGIIIIHPNWWGQPPAILKGWVDRVFIPGVAYQFKPGDTGEGVPEGLLKLKAALVINTSDTAWERERDVFGDPLETLWKNCIFSFCGVQSFHRKTFRIVVKSTPEERLNWLKEAETITKKLFQAD